MLDILAVRTPTYYETYDETYIDVTYTIRIRRRTLYYFSNLILPCVLIGKCTNIVYDSSKIIPWFYQYNMKIFLTKFKWFRLTASMSVLGFYFPPESGEKVSLEITILMSLTFFMQVVSDMQPPSSDIPLISKYFTCIMIMVASSVVSNYQ